MNCKRMERSGSRAASAYADGPWIERSEPDAPKPGEGGRSHEPRAQGAPQFSRRRGGGLRTTSDTW